jgi:hypothetical protein
MPRFEKRRTFDYKTVRKVSAGRVLCTSEVRGTKKGDWVFFESRVILGFFERKGNLSCNIGRVVDIACGADAEGLDDQPEITKAATDYRLGSGKQIKGFRGLVLRRLIRNCCGVERASKGQLELRVLQRRRSPICSRVSSVGAECRNYAR